MVNVEELRIGNIVERIDTHELVKVRGTGLFVINPCTDYEFEEVPGHPYTYSGLADKLLIPIQLTKDLLLKCQFEEWQYMRYLHIFQRELEVVEYGDSFAIAINNNELIIGNRFSYLHQLQNLFFDLTSKELDVSNFIIDNLYIRVDEELINILDGKTVFIEKLEISEKHSRSREFKFTIDGLSEEISEKRQDIYACMTELINHLNKKIKYGLLAPAKYEIFRLGDRLEMFFPCDLIMIKELKKGDKFVFGDKVFSVIKRYGRQPLRSTDGYRERIFDYGELEVEKIIE